MTTPRAPVGSRIPQPPDRYEGSYMRRMLEALRQELGFCLRTETANKSVLLMSPGGQVYEVTVSDAGALVVTYVQG